ncbi:MAG: hypothetical protein KGV44_01395 [Flavobacteriaceae bacterium]|nr:hypothetical protein [Flavobacteriaceae bacterium]
MPNEVEIIEKYGLGIKRIKQARNEYGIKPPVFEEFCNGFRVVLYKEEINGRINEGKEILIFVPNNPKLKFS